MSKYSTQFKPKVIQEYLKGGSYLRVANLYGINIGLREDSGIKPLKNVTALMLAVNSKLWSEVLGFEK